MFSIGLIYLDFDYTISYYRPFYSRLAQLVERRTVNPNVTGSSPVV